MPNNLLPTLLRVCHFEASFCTPSFSRLQDPGTCRALDLDLQEALVTGMGTGPVTSVAHRVHRRGAKAAPLWGARNGARMGAHEAEPWKQRKRRRDRKGERRVNQAHRPRSDNRDLLGTAFRPPPASCCTKPMQAPGGTSTSLSLSALEGQGGARRTQAGLGSCSARAAPQRLPGQVSSNNLRGVEGSQGCGRQQSSFSGGL